MAGTVSTVTSRECRGNRVVLVPVDFGRRGQVLSDPFPSVHGMDEERAAAGDAARGAAAGADLDAAMINRMMALQQRIAADEAELARTMDGFVRLRDREVLEETGGRQQARPVAAAFAVDEMAAALRWSRARVHERVRLVRRVRRTLPMVWAAWSTGQAETYLVSKVAETAQRLVEPTSVDALDAAVTADPSGSAGPAGVLTTRTAGQLQHWLHRFVARTEPDQLEARSRLAFAERRVVATQEGDGVGALWARTSAVDLAQVDHQLTLLARQLGTDDPRTMDQRRADLLVDLLLRRSPTSDPAAGGGTRVARPGVVAVTVPIQSLLGLDDAPGELVDRSASVPASVIREIARQPGTLFFRLLTDPRGNLLDVTELGRFPSRLLEFTVDIRDGTCREAFCEVPSTRCDLDHLEAHPEGPTSAANLAPRCRHGHRAKTSGGFGVEQPEPGVFVTTTPTGHRYTTRPDPLPVGRWPHPDDPPPDDPPPDDRETSSCCTDCCTSDVEEPSVYLTDLLAALPPHIGFEDLDIDDHDRFAELVTATSD